jgi:choline dehydrogenase-like flavoprotein
VGTSNQPTASKQRCKIVVIGSGFGGTMTGLSLARALKARNKGESVLILERGTWWTTPVGTVQDKEVRAYDFLRQNKQPVQFWSSLNHFRGFLDIFTRCLRKPGNIDGLYQMETLGKRPLLGLFGGENDGVSVVRASGVGGGSLVYSNITIRPPELIFADERWRAMTWDKARRDEYFELARQAIGVGVVYALNERSAKGKDPNVPSPDRISGKVSAYMPSSSIILDSASASKTYAISQKARIPADMRINDAVWLETDGTGQATSVERQGPFKVNTGLSNILGRTAAVPADSRPGPVKPGDPFNPRGIKQLIRDKKDPAAPEPFQPYDDSKDALWIDRARVFQTAVSNLTSDYGAVDLAINDLPQEPQLFEPAGNPKNYCERQGRCNIGCLPGARHTLNKQLMIAALGKPNPDGSVADPQFKDTVSISPLCEVDYIEALPSGGYRIHYIQYAPDDSPQRGQKTQKTVLAEKLIVSAGCLGTNELLLRSKQRSDGLPALSDKTGCGFSTNGDYIGFLEEINEHVTLTRGPVTTSFAHLNTNDLGTELDQPRFHTIEDQGVPPALASVVGVGVPLIRSLGKGRGERLFVLLSMLLWAMNRLVRFFEAFFKNAEERQDFFKSQEEITGKMMCVVAQGRESAVGQFRLGECARETGLRVKRSDGKAFHEDPVYKDIEASLQKLADKLVSPTAKKPRFINPFLMDAAGAFNATSVPSPHPLGGCRIGEDISKGVVDEFGRVYKKDDNNSKDVYQGLYVADAAIIPTALGVNPSLTISALSLRIADSIISEL